MLKKLVNYYKSFGLIELLKKIKRYLIFLKNGGLYKISKKEKKYITLKDKKAYIFTYHNYKNINQKMKEVISYLNQIGFQVIYICIENIKGGKNLPLSIYKSVQQIKNDDVLFSNDDIVLLHGNYKEFEKWYDITRTKKIKIFNIKDKEMNKNKYLIKTLNSYTEEIEIEKSNNEFYDKIASKKCLPTFFGNISIIVLNYNNLGVIEKCVESLQKYSKKYNYEIIIVDNQSNDGSYELIKEKYKNIKIIRNSKNGCSSGRNLGVAMATKEYIIFLDSDQWVTHKHWLDNYIKILYENPKIGAVGWAGGWFDKKGFACHTFDDFEYRYMPPQGLYRYDIGYLGSGGLMMSKKLFEEIKGFDINYDPTCYEDTDLSVNIRYHKKEIAYCPYLGILHNPHQTTKSGSKLHDELIKRKGDYFVKKWNAIDPKLLKYHK